MFPGGQNDQIQQSPKTVFITMTSKWAPRRPRSPASQLLSHPFVQARLKENIKAGDRSIPLTKG